MTIDKIITLANAKSRLMFTVMERSLRATGCDLPLQVIPYDSNKFDLPKNSYWLEEPSFYEWVDKTCAHPMMRKYLPLTLANYHYLDTDAIFLKNPESVLAPYEGFVASDTEWNKIVWTVTPSSKKMLEQRWSTWQKDVFCAGQYACDRALYTQESLRQFCEKPENRPTCIDFPLHDQPGTNLLVLSTDVPRINLTLPPVKMESTMAGDYHTMPSWNSEQAKPYIMHYAGHVLHEDRPINSLFFDFFTKAERQEWEEHRVQERAKVGADRPWPLGVRLFNQVAKKFYPTFLMRPL